ncbi:protein-export chaperone SecB, partial [Francisella tularensis]|uniref:protein-export chaperone SecB n=1 Tax=Francisella tularensis TaxID=263 RepID=UPI0023819655
MDLQAQPQFQIHKVYVKDLSFSIPYSDKIWTTNWNPELHTDLIVEATKLPDENTYETVLPLEVIVV